MNKMTIDINWKQSQEVRMDFMSLLRDSFKEIIKLIRLENELVQLQTAETETIVLSDIEVTVDEFSIYEKKEEIKECKSVICEKLNTMEITMYDDSDLIFMYLNELEEKIDDNKSEIENCQNEIDELVGEMEDN